MRESARDPLGLVTDRLRTANPELAQAYDLWTAHLAAPPTIDELLRTADHSRPAMPEPSRDRVEAYRTPVRVGGASLTLSTRAPWRTELIARLGPIDGLRAPAGHDLGEVLRVKEIGIGRLVGRSWSSLRRELLRQAVQSAGPPRQDPRHEPTHDGELELA